MVLLLLLLLLVVVLLNPLLHECQPGLLLQRRHLLLHRRQVLLRWWRWSERGPSASASTRPELRNPLIKIQRRSGPHLQRAWHGVGGLAVASVSDPRG